MWHTIPSKVVAQRSRNLSSCHSFHFSSPWQSQQPCLLPSVPCSSWLPAFPEGFYPALCLWVPYPRSILFCCFVFAKVLGAVSPTLMAHTYLESRTPSCQPCSSQTLWPQHPQLSSPWGSSSCSAFHPRTPQGEPCPDAPVVVLRHCWDSGTRNSLSCWLAKSHCLTDPGPAHAPPKFPSKWSLWTHTGLEELGTACAAQKRKGQKCQPALPPSAGRAQVAGAQQGDVSNTNVVLLPLGEGKHKQSDVLSYFLCLPLRR